MIDVIVDTYDIFVGVRMTSLPVLRQTFAYLSLVLFTGFEDATAFRGQKGSGPPGPWRETPFCIDKEALASMRVC